MTFLEKYKQKVNTAGRFVFPIVVVIVGIALGALLLGFIGEGLWFCITWCLQRIWKIALVAVVVFLVIAIIVAQNE